MFFLYFCHHYNKSPTKKGVFLFYLFLPLLKGCFPLFLPYSNQSSATNGVFSIFALILTKSLPKWVFFSLFCPNSSQRPTKRMFFSSFAPILIKALSLKVFPLFSPYSNQSPTKRVFSLFALTLTKALPQRKFFSFLPLKALPKRLFFFIFVFILAKALPQRKRFSTFALHSNQSLPNSLFLPLF